MPVQSSSKSRFNRPHRGTRLRALLSGAFFIPPTLAAFAVLLTAAPALHAQDITGTLFGTVTDSTGAVIPGATVVATSVERGTTRTLRSNNSGEFSFNQVPVGSYNVTVTSSGFKSFSQRNVAVDAAASARVEAKLVPGNVDTTVTVESTAAELDLRSATVGTLIDPTTVQETPIDGNNIVNLAALLPGITSITAPAAFTNERQGPTFSASGSRVGQNLFLFDGIIYNNFFRNTGANFPPRETTQEIQVLTNNYGAEYGRNAGAIFPW